MERNDYLKLNEIALELTIKKSLDFGLSLKSLKEKVNIKNSQKIIGMALYSLSMYLNLKETFKSDQCFEVAGLFLKEWENENIEDILICIKNIKLGKYGTLYNRLDGQVIFECFQKYLDEKYETLETHYKKLKHEQIDYSNISPESEKLSEIFLDKIKSDLKTIIEKSTQQKLSLKSIAILGKELKSKRK